MHAGEPSSLAVYSARNAGTTEVDPECRDLELYDYGTAGGLLELDNATGRAPGLEGPLSELLKSRVIPHEIREPLPARLLGAQEQGLTDFYATTNERTP